MKGNQAEYVISLVGVFKHPPLKRIKRALNEIKRFVRKHTRIEDVLIDTEVNEFLHKNSKNIPRKVNATLVKAENKIIVYLSNSKRIEEDKKKREERKKEKSKEDKEKKKPKKETKEKAKEKTEEEKKEAEHKKKLEEKKQAEKAADAVEHKRK
ncbi:MAG: hypothetical protein ABIA76_01695 [Candidatus Diapherotrites archaeon]